MSSHKQTQPWVPLEKIDYFVQVEPALVIFTLVLVSWVIWKFLLRELHSKRHETIQVLFKNLTVHLLGGIFLYGSYLGLERIPYESAAIERLMVYSGLGTILWGAIIFVKVCRVLVFEYLYLSHMKVAFPVLLVNLFTLILSIALATWIGTEVFNFRLAPILATSAIFSLVLGLALQDTLGNLFAGVALQFDKPYEIGNWIEVQAEGQKWVGQVHEISWRATVLVAPTEELITVPNRTMSQAQIANYSTGYRPIVRGVNIRVAHQADIKIARQLLFQVAQEITDIRTQPAPNVFVNETTDSWVNLRLVYHIDDFSKHMIIGDKVFSRALELFKASGVRQPEHSLFVRSG